MIGKYFSKPHLENLPFFCKKLLSKRVHVLEIILLITDSLVAMAQLKCTQHGFPLDSLK